MDIWSNQNGAQFYTSNFLNLTKTSNGQKYGIHEGFCIETSGYPNAINQVILSYLLLDLAKPLNKFLFFKASFSKFSAET